MIYIDDNAGYYISKYTKKILYQDKTFTYNLAYAITRS